MAEKMTKELATLNKRFIQYVAETKKEYKYTLKFAVPQMTESMIDCIESALTKYQLKQASAFKTTPIQENPLDFPNVNNMPVQITDITLGYPASLDFLRIFLGNTLGISTAQIAVYSENDPRQIETDLFLERSSPEFKENYVPVLNSEHLEKIDPVFTEGSKSEHYGEAYNSKFLQELERVRKERQITIAETPLSPAETVDHSTLPAGYHDFRDPSQLPKPEYNTGLFGRMKKPSIAGAK
jgi:hypothetical protein